jgi:hypothetical protein
MKKSYFFIFLIFLVGCLSISISKKERVIILNPYKDIDWKRIKRYKANLHTHTNKSDGKFSPEEVINLYKNRNYSILSITDHNKFVYPEAKEIFLIKGVEISKKQHHILSYFSFKIPQDIENVDEDEILKNIDKNGLVVFAHPGRYKKEIEWYVKFFEKYENLIGIEVLNPSVQVKVGKIYGDKDIWDEILKRTMPYRPVWGFANDDFHDLTQFSLNWNEFLIENLNEKNIKEAMRNGKFYICSAILGYDMPYIRKISVDEKKGVIKIDASNHKKIKWISDGEIVCEKNEINFKNNEKIRKYLRVEIYGEKGYIYLNPFGIKRGEK